MLIALSVARVNLHFSVPEQGPEASGCLQRTRGWLILLLGARQWSHYRFGAKESARLSVGRELWPRRPVCRGMGDTPGSGLGGGGKLIGNDPAEEPRKEGGTGGGREAAAAKLFGGGNARSKKVCPSI